MSKLQYWVKLKDGAGPTGGSALRDWDRLVLDSVTFPGLAMVEPETAINFDTPTPVDIKATQSSGDGSTTNPRYRNTLLYKGWVPAKIIATLQIWIASDWDDFQPIFKKFVPQKTTTLQKAFTISHPATDLLGVDKVSIVGVSIPQIVEQTLTIRMTMVQWFPPSILFLSKFDKGNTQGVPTGRVK